MSRHRRLTPDERGQIVREREKGVSTQALALNFGVSRQTIHNTIANDRKRQVDAHVKTAVINARVSDADARMFDSVLQQFGVPSRGEGLRRLMSIAADLYVPDTKTATALKSLSASLGRVGSNVNQIAARLNEARVKKLPPPYDARSDAEIRALAALIFDLSDQIEDLAKAQRTGLKLIVDPALRSIAHVED
jgi:transposase-like protein